MATAKNPAPRKQQAGEEPVRAKDIKAKKVRWLWQERIPVAQIVILAGRPDGGKSLFAAHVSSALSREGKNILYSAVEDSPEMLTRPRLEVAGADLNNVLLYRFVLPSQLDLMAEKVLKHQIKLVVIDPISAHLDRGVTKTTDSIRQVTTPLQKLCERTGVTFLIIDHVVKKVQKGSHPLAAVGGTSSGLPAACRMAFLFGKDPKDTDRMILAAIKHNLRDRPEPLAYEQESKELGMVGEIPFLLPQGETPFDPMKLLLLDDKGKKGRKPEKRAEINEWLTGHLTIHGPISGKTLYEDAAHMGFSERTVRRAADDMGEGIQRTRGGGRGGASGQWDLGPELRAFLSKKQGGK